MAKLATALDGFTSITMPTTSFANVPNSNAPEITGLIGNMLSSVPVAIDIQ